MTFSSVYSQSNCRFEKGEIYELRQSGVNIRKTPNLGNNVIAKIESPNYSNDFSFEIVDAEAINNFVKVKFIVYDSLSTYIRLKDTICWINTDLIKYTQTDFFFEPNYKLLSESQEGIDFKILLDSMIDLFDNLKFINSCKYSTERHSHYYLKRGIVKFYDKDYVGSIYDLSMSIRIAPENSEIIKSYGFRAYAKEELEDFSGAIEDYSNIILKCNGKTSSICEVCSQHKGLRFNSGEEFCKEDLLIRRSICYSQIKKYQFALNDLNAVILLDTNFGYAYYIRGQLKDILNDKAGCCKDLSKAGELGIEDAYEEIKKRCGKQ